MIRSPVECGKTGMILFLISLLLFVEVRAQQQISMELEEEILLDEELRATSDRMEGIFSRLDDGFVHSDEQAIVAIAYNDEGEQIAELGARGDRSFEYAAVMDIYTYEDTIYLFTRDGRRITFGPNGEEIRQLDLVDQNYRKFVGTDDHIYALPSNPEDETGLYEFEIGDLNRVTDRELGEVSKEDRWLRNVSFAGGMINRETQVYWINPATPVVYKYSGDNSELSSYEFEVSDNWRDVPIEATGEEIQEEPSILAEFIQSRSVINGLYDLGNSWLVEIGHNHDNSLELIILDEEFEKTGTIILPNERFSMDHYGHRIRMADESGIYFYNETINENGEVVKLLSRWKLSK